MRSIQIAIKSLVVGVLADAGAMHSQSLLNDDQSKLKKAKRDKGMAKPIREQMLESSSAKLWGTLEDGTNQGVKHFADY